MGASTSPTSVADAPDFAREREAVERALESLCATQLHALPERTRDAVRYCLEGGKRLRPVMMLEAYRAAGGRADASALAATIEVVHAYSLAHDDLPCMDDDDVRRGRPTLHRVFGEAVATAAGVAMVPLAARSAVLACESLGLAPSTTSEIVRELMRASGATGMVGGQWLDLATEGCALSVEELEAIHQAKTGALIAAAVVIGGMAAGADMNRIAALRAYGRSVGLAFQIADDVLDATSTTATLGKTAGRDAERNKHTYPALLGVEGATERARALVDVACDSLRRAEVRSTTLERLAHFSVTRRK